MAQEDRVPSVLKFRKKMCLFEEKRFKSLSFNPIENTLKGCNVT
jgi:hypothetical protein